MTKFLNPFTAAAVGLMLSVAVGVAMCYKVLQPLLAQAIAAAKPKEMPEEEKKRGWDFWTVEIENLSSELKEERARLKKQAETLDQRAARLDGEEKEFARLRADVETMRKNIETRVIEISADEAKNLKSLSTTYATLTPRAVVAIFKEMDDATVVKLLSLMKTDITGPIFEEMSKPNGADTSTAKRAAALSEKIRLMKSQKAPAAP